jgi:hypothetical protein
MHQQGSAYRSHDLMVEWDNNFGVEFLLKSLDYTLIKGDPALKHYRGLNTLP